METDLFTLGADQVVDDVTGGGREGGWEGMEEGGKGWRREGRDGGGRGGEG